MSRKPETVFIASVHKHLPKDLYRIKNNNPFAGGQADVWYSGMRADLWVEYKFAARVPKTGLSADLSELQKIWLHDRHKEGRNVAVIIGTKEGGVLLRNLAWENTISPEYISNNLQSRQDLARWIQSETGECHDQERSGDLQHSGRIAASGGQQPGNLCRPARRPARAKARPQP
jgi:hypothetical protein